MLLYIEKSYIDIEIDFSIENQHVRCLAHIINLAAQSTLNHLKTTEANDKDTSITIKVRDIIIKDRRP